MIFSVYESSDSNIKLSFPWVNDSLIMVLPKHSKLQFDINDKTVELHALRPMIQLLIKNYPRTKFVIVESNGMLNDMLNKGEVDTCINFQLNSMFYNEILNGEGNSIHSFNITSFTEYNPVSLGVSSPELLGIINDSLEARPHFNEDVMSAIPSENK